MTDYTELKRLAESLEGAEWFSRVDMPPCSKSESDFISLANPAAVLALIAENEANRYEREVVCANYDQLKAESERLQESHEQVCTNYNQVSYASEERGKQIDQLRAEVAGLKTGYEAYERVNAELKAEVEGLRGNASLMVLLPGLDAALEDLEVYGQHSDQGYRKLKDWYRKMDLVCKAIDAALGQGEQS